MEFATPASKREWANAMSASSQQRSARRIPAASKTSQNPDPNEIDVSWCSATGNWWRKTVVMWFHKMDSRKLKACVFVTSVCEAPQTWQHEKKSQHLRFVDTCRSTSFRSIRKFGCLACTHVDGFTIFVERWNGAGTAVVQVQVQQGIYCQSMSEHIIFHGNRKR